MQGRQLVHVILAIAICVKDQLLSRVLEARTQGGAITQVPRMVNHLDVRRSARQLVKHCGRGVSAPVVNDQHFVVVGQGWKDVEGAQDKRQDGARIVEGWKEHTYTSADRVRFHSRQARLFETVLRSLYFTSTTGCKTRTMRAQGALLASSFPIIESSF